MKVSNPMAPVEFSRLFNQCSKQSLIDSLWCACQLGTDESDSQITTQSARNAIIALQYRGDRVSREMRIVASKIIDSD